MYDDDGADPISEWANNLTPEGAPGEMATMMRKMLGDQGYERMVAQHDAITEMHMERQRLINKILSLIVIYGTFFGALAAGSLMALVVICARNFS
jgi:hypothetical protein